MREVAGRTEAEGHNRGPSSTRNVSKPRVDFRPTWRIPKEIKVKILRLMFEAVADAVTAVPNQANFSAGEERPARFH